jgi:VanZ family protein
MVIAYGALSEVIQATVITTRDGDVRDFAADALGALLAWLAVSRWARRGR